MLENLKNKISENSGVVNMVINLSILYLLFTVASGIKDLKQSVGQVQQQTTGTLQPVMESAPVTDDELRRLVLDVIIAKLQEARNEDIKR
jgi:hypothetical protein